MTSKTIRTARLSDVVDIIDNPETSRIVCHGKEFAIVKHGHWKSSLTGWVYCSVCNTEPPDETNIRSKYCPNCGAEMDEVET